MMVNNPLIRPAISSRGVGIGGVPLDSQKNKKKGNKGSLDIQK